MIRKIIIIAAHIAAYAAILGACAIWHYPDAVSVLVPPFIAALIPIAIADAVIWRVTHPPAPRVDYDSMDIQDLDDLSKELSLKMNEAYKFRKMRDAVKQDGWDPDRLREIVAGEWAAMDKTASAWMFDGKNDQQEWHERLDRKYHDCLPPIVDLCEDFVLWVGQNKTKSLFCTVGEGGGRLIPRREIRYLDWESYSVKCAACGRKIETVARRRDDTSERWGVTYGTEEYYFCSPRCRCRWMEKGSGRDFRDPCVFWEEWMERDENDYQDMQILRCGYYSRR